ncbi:GAF domain-containing protein [Pseudoalteromonas sp. G4]|uniref:GAF domain-containing protein n=1 Tax=Pseudoalteromonas sp. G4 TaxID=2992761 RepID=UPI00237E268D|nr:histidine kinase [Pseudoalteromonas sp. G4]MDE3271189.1 histidine kinase [Pseudoalteromonas sp. G4]
MANSIDFTDYVIDPAKVADFRQQLETEIQQSNEQQIVWQYLIPELGEGGSCSLFGQLQEAPFELTQYIAANESNTQALAALTSVVSFVEKQKLIDWFGIYQSRQIEGQTQLLKLSYFGNPSRPLFPVDENYARISNNAFVALHGKGRVINNVKQYVANGGEYYTCDPAVKSEVCLPYFSDSGEVLGIIDAEAFDNDVFNQDALALLQAICEVVPNYLPE